MTLASVAPSECLRCRRTLSKVDRRWDRPADEDRGVCGFCGTPFTDAARRRLLAPGVATQDVPMNGLSTWRHGQGRGGSE